MGARISILYILYIDSGGRRPFCTAGGKSLKIPGRPSISKQGDGIESTTYIPLSKQMEKKASLEAIGQSLLEESHVIIKIIYITS